MASCNWDERTQSYNNDDGLPSTFDLYGEFSKVLGSESNGTDALDLTTAVIPLKAGSFYHYGTSRELIGSTYHIQNKVTDQREILHKRIKPHPDIFVMNVVHDGKLDENNRNLWIENSYIPKGWKFSHSHIFTGIPGNNWDLHIPPGICIDIIPIKDNEYCIRPYGIDDTFSGNTGDSSVKWLNLPLVKWLDDRNLQLEDVSAENNVDIYDLPLFPVLLLTNQQAG
jgi:hypothetical protein